MCGKGDFLTRFGRLDWRENEKGRGGEFDVAEIRLLGHGVYQEYASSRLQGSRVVISGP